MAITTNAIANSFKKELLEGKHNFTQTTGDVLTQTENNLEAKSDLEGEKSSGSSTVVANAQSNTTTNSGNVTTIVQEPSSKTQMALAYARRSFI